MQKLMVVDDDKNNMAGPMATAVFFSSAVLMISANSLPMTALSLPDKEAATTMQVGFTDNAALEFEKERSLVRQVAKEIEAEQTRQALEREQLQESVTHWKTVKTIRTTSVTRSVSPAVPPLDTSSLLDFALSLRGVNYVYGGTNPQVGLDCSAFTQLAFRKIGIEIPRVSFEQFRVGVGIPKANLIPGDLVFFSTNGPGATHVGIYVGDGNFISATTKGVQIQALDSDYWSKTYRGSRRVR